MNTFFPETRLGLNHLQVIVRGMWAVARCDGVHDTESTMLRDFYRGCSQDAEALTDFDALVSRDFDIAEATDVLTSDELKRVFLQSCMFLAYADGAYSAQENALISQYASNLGMSQDTLTELRGLVGDHLISQVARVHNVDGLKAVVRDVFHDQE